MSFRFNVVPEKYSTRNAGRLKVTGKHFALTLLVSEIGFIVYDKKYIDKAKEMAWIWRSNPRR